MPHNNMFELVLQIYNVIIEVALGLVQFDQQNTTPSSRPFSENARPDHQATGEAFYASHFL